MRQHFSQLARTALIGVLFLALGATLGFAQPNAEKAGAGPAADQVLVAEPGVLIVGVQAGSPAAKAGIVRGDIILEAGGTVMNAPESLVRAVDTRKPGDMLSLKVRHGDALKTLRVTLGERSGRAWMGVMPYPAGEFMRDGLRPPVREGAFVARVAPGSPAEKAGLKQGDVILAVDGAEVDARNSLGDLIAAKKAGDAVTLSVRSQREDRAQPARDVKVTLERNPNRDGAYLGVEYAMAPRRGDRAMPGPGMREGVLVAEVTSDSPAAKAGIRARDLITKVEGAVVEDPQQIVDAVARHTPGDTLTITVRRMADDKDTELTVSLGSNPGDAAKAWMGISMRDIREEGPGFEGMPRFHPKRPVMPAPGKAPPVL
jgi:S1-C subfamily serine protease